MARRPELVPPPAIPVLDGDEENINQQRKYDRDMRAFQDQTIHSVAMSLYAIAYRLEQMDLSV